MTRRKRQGIGRSDTTGSSANARVAAATVVTTDQRLIAAAIALLDAGGGSAVTIRAVAQAVGVSHNAQYKHFANRSALLRAVALQDFAMLADAFAGVRRLPVKPLAKLRRALACFVAYGQDHPARYRLLFSDPDIATPGGDPVLEAAAMRPFAAFAAIVRGCQEAQELPDVPNAELTGLIYAAVHGLIDLQASGRLHQEKGLAGVPAGVDVLVRILARA